MSKTAADCCICAVEPATDRFGWCDRCASLYDQPSEPTESDEEDMEAQWLNAVLLSTLFSNADHMELAQ